MKRNLFVICFGSFLWLSTATALAGSTGNCVETGLSGDMLEAAIDGVLQRCPQIPSKDHLLLLQNRSKRCDDDGGAPLSKYQIALRATVGDKSKVVHVVIFESFGMIESVVAGHCNGL